MQSRELQLFVGSDVTNSDRIIKQVSYEMLIHLTRSGKLVVDVGMNTEVKDGLVVRLGQCVQSTYLNRLTRGIMINLHPLNTL